MDDNRDAADSIGILLRADGAEVRVAYDGDAALKEVDRLRPTAVVLDIGMPGIDGYEVARKIRAQPGHQDVLLVALSGWGQEQDRRRALEVFDHHLTKPVDIAALRRHLLSTRDRI